MALSGLGPALSGAYANIQKLLLTRRMEQEDLDRRRQEAAADRQAQQDWWRQQMMQQRLWTAEDRAAELAAQEPARRQTEARATLDQIERLVLAGLIPPQDISGLITQATPGVAPFLPQRTSPFGDVPGSFEQRIPGMIPGAPAQTFQGGPAPMMIRPPQRARTLAEVQPDFFGPGAPGAQFGMYPVPLTEDGQPDAVKIAGLVDKIRGGMPKEEAPVARRTRVTQEVQTMLSGVRQSISGGDVQGAVTQAQAYNARIAEARKAGVSLPFQPLDVRVIERDARGRYRRIVREGGAGGATETNAAFMLRLRQKYLRGETTPEEERLLFGPQGARPTSPRLAALLTQEAEAYRDLESAKADVAALPKGSGAKEQADRALVRAQARFNAIRKQISDSGGQIPSLSYGQPPTFGLRVGAPGTEEQRPPGGQQVVATLPPASSVLVGTEAVDNRTGKRYRSDGKKWVVVP